MGRHRSGWVAVGCALVVAGCALVSPTVPRAFADPAVPAEPTPGQPAPAADHLTITVERSPTSSHNGTFELSCNPAGGNHPEPANACARLDQLAGTGDPFVPVAAGQMCTQIFGGPATARLTGSFRGRFVDATFSRSDGCQTGRWDKLVPVLPPESI